MPSPVPISVREAPDPFHFGIDLLLAEYPQIKTGDFPFDLTAEMNGFVVCVTDGPASGSRFTVGTAVDGAPKVCRRTGIPVAGSGRLASEG